MVYIVIEEKESKRSFSVVANVDLLQLRWSFVDKNTNVEHCALVLLLCLKIR